ncbi:MAG TPA: four helix bundle protein [Candidatus Paceibacterota bacterium]|nr:four helix bundle protein [Candidatus Paceibacterota bacterium]
MSQDQTEKNAPANGRHVLFDHEKLDVYRLELQFVAWVTPLLEEVLRGTAAKTREVCDQLDRASLSTMLNTAEGNGKRQRQIRAKYFDDARGSATECAACLDALVAKCAAAETRIIDGKKMLLRIVSMLCGLVDRFDSGTALHETEDGIEINNDLQPVSYLKAKSRTRTRTRKRGRI